MGETIWFFGFLKKPFGFSGFSIKPFGFFGQLLSRSEIPDTIKNYAGYGNGYACETKTQKRGIQCRTGYATGYGIGYKSKIYFSARFVFLKYNCIFSYRFVFLEYNCIQKHTSRYKSIPSHTNRYGRIRRSFTLPENQKSAVSYAFTYC